MKHKHLTLDDRITIEVMLKSSHSFKQIAQRIGKDCTCISKEIRARRVFRRTGALGRSFCDCLNRSSCRRGVSCIDCPDPIPCHLCRVCHRYCSDYQICHCTRLDLAPYVCNGCEERCRCTLEKRIYIAREAHREYEYILRQSRSGIALSQEELSAMDSYLKPLIGNGLSLNHILVHARDKVMCCEKTVRNYIHKGVFSFRNIDLQEQVRRRPRKSRHDDFKVDRSCRIGRTYEQYKAFLEEHPDVSFVEMDTLEGTRGGPCLLTLKFTAARFILAFLRPSNDARSVREIFDELYDRLGHADFVRIFPGLLTDNGSEFSDPLALEFKDGVRRTFVFFCDPGVPSQKGSVENGNRDLRPIFPKGHSMDHLTREKVLRATNHVNSEVRFSVGQKSAYEAFAFLYGEQILKKLGAELIPHDQIVLLPSLVK